jgi:hypothetical protein
MKYSIVFTEYDPNGENLQMSHSSLKTVVHNSLENYELIHVRDAHSYVEAINEGLTKAKGDYITFVSNDIFLQETQWLTKFTRDGIGGWRYIPFVLTGEMRPDFSCWSISRSTLDTMGLMDMSFSEGMGFEDDDYIYTARIKNVPLYNAEIRLEHLEGQTVDKLFKETKEEKSKHNRDVFKKKWNV